MDMATLNRVSALNEEAKKVAWWGIKLEGALHQIAEHMEGVPENVREYAKNIILEEDSE